MRHKLVFLLAIVFGLLAALGVYRYLQNLQESYRTSGNYKQVVVARQVIAARTMITEQMVQTKDIPVEMIQPGTAMELSEVVGKVCRSELYPGEPIRTDRLYRDQDPSGELALQIPPGQRALTVQINEVSGLAGLLRPGDRVDVLVTFDQAADKTSLSTLLLQNVRVLAVGQTTAGAPGNDKKISVQTATLALAPELLPQLTLAAERGSIRLALRSPKDQGIVNLPSARLANLIR